MAKFRYTFNEEEYDVSLEKYLDIIKSYWEFSDGEFSNKPKEIAKQHDINTYELLNIVKSYSTGYVQTGACDKNGCLNVTEEAVWSHASARIANKKNIKPSCSDCLEKIASKEEKKYKNRSIEFINYSFENAIKSKAWLKLNEEAFDTLMFILQANGSYEIFRYLFQDEGENKAAWRPINELEKQNLLYLERDESKAIQNFLTPPNLEEHIKEHISTGRFTQKDDVDFISLTIPSTSKDQTSVELGYTGEIKFNLPIKIEAGTKYNYSLISLPDGGLKFNLTPSVDNYELVEYL